MDIILKGKPFNYYGINEIHVRFDNGMFAAICDGGAIELFENETDLKKCPNDGIPGEIIEDWKIWINITPTYLLTEKNQLVLKINLCLN